MSFNWINVSGGKDSTALAIWSLETGLADCRYVFADTQHEHPITYEYLTYLEDRLGIKIERVQSEGMLNLCIRKQRFPSVKARFCTEQLKVIPLARYMDEAEEHDGDHPHQVFVGIRAEESPARAKMPETIFSNVKYPPRRTSYQLRHHPLLDMYTGDVFALMKRHNIEPNPLYKMGMSRVGCFPCIMARQPELKKICKNFPETIDKLEDWEKQVAAASKQGAGTWIPTSALPKGVPAGFRNYAAYLDEGEEFPGMEQDPGGCMSIYGLCE